MNIVLLEGLAVPQQTIEELAASLKEQGHTFTAWLDGKWDPETLIQRAKDADILMVANSPLPAQVVQACSRLKMISVAFTGVDHIPMEVCRQRGVLVCNCAGYSTTAVAELVFGLVLGLARRIPACDGAARHGGTKAGLVGLRGAVLARAFGCKVIAYSRTEKQEALELGVRYRSLEEVMAQSDIVSLHVPATAQTKGLISAEMIARMKPGALLINTARGPVVDSAALADALKAGRIAGAGIDVFETEPPIPEDHPLCSAPNTLLTPHVAFATEESMVLRANMVFENVQLYLNGTPRNVMA